MTVEEIKALMKAKLKPRILENVVAVRHYVQDSKWIPTGNRTIGNVHAEYDAGYVDIFHVRLTSPPDGWFALVAIPRKRRAEIRAENSFGAIGSQQLMTRKSTAVRHARM